MPDNYHDRHGVRTRVRAYVAFLAQMMPNAQVVHGRRASRAISRFTFANASVTKYAALSVGAVCNFQALPNCIARLQRARAIARIAFPRGNSGGKKRDRFKFLYLLFNHLTRADIIRIFPDSSKETYLQRYLFKSQLVTVFFYD